MESKLSTFSQLSEPDRLIFIAKINHAIWYDENIYNRVKSLIEYSEDNLPDAQYFPPTPPHQIEL